MAQRLGQGLDVGYRPLTPADDVSGLAGQKQAVDEFTALSTDTARKAAAAQAAAELMVKQQIEQGKLMNQARQIGVSAMNAATGAASQRARATAANQELMMQHRMLPAKMEAMELQNEQRRIQNDYAVEQEELGLESKRMQIAINKSNFRADLKDQADLNKIPRIEADMQTHLDGGNDIDDFDMSKYGLGAAGTAEAERRRAQLKKSTQSVRIDKENDKIVTDILALEDPNMSATLDKPKYGGGGPLNDLGKEMLQRMTKTKKQNLTGRERHDITHFRNKGDTRPVDASDKLAEMVDGSLVLTQEGIDYFEKKRAALEPDVVRTGVSITEEGGKIKKVWTGKPKLQIESDARQKMTEAYQKANDGKLPVGAELQNINREAFKQSNFEVKSGTTEAQILRAKSEGKELYVIDPATGYPIDFNDETDDTKLSPDEFQRRIMDAVERNASGGVGLVAGETEQLMQRAGKADGAIIGTPNAGDFTTNVPWPGEENSTVGKKEWDKSIYAVKGTVADKLRDPKGGYNMPPEVVETVIAYMADKEVIAGIGKQGHKGNPELIIDKAINHFVSKEMAGPVGDLAQALHFGDLPLPWRGTEGDNPTWREGTGEEIISVALSQNKKLMEFLDKPDKEWEGEKFHIWTLMERAWDVGVPNQLGSGHLPDKTKESYKFEFTLEQPYHNVKNIKAALRKLVSKTAQLEKMHFYSKNSLFEPGEVIGRKRDNQTVYHAWKPGGKSEKNNPAYGN